MKATSTRAPSAATPPGRWFGKCPGCNAFGSLVEETPAAVGRAAAKPLLRLVDVDAEEAKRISTGVPELDRVLGGGLVPASLVLVGGEPGVGKSTLLLSALGAVSSGGRRALLVTGEESTAQVKLRAARLGGTEEVEILAETELDAVCATLERERPDVCVIDSIQTLYAAELGSAPGSVGQVREAAGRLLRVAKEHSVATILVGHVTKDGAVAGPARARAPRRLRAPVRGRPLPRPPRPPGDEEPLRLDQRARRLRDDRSGLVGVPDPVRALRQDAPGEIGAAVACALEGTRPILLEIQALVAPTDLAMPRRVGTGVDPKRLAMIVAGAPARRRAARLRGRLRQRRRRPADRRAGRRPRDRARDRLGRARRAGARGVAAFGEIGLTGRLRPAAQSERRLEECAKLGVVAARGIRRNGAAPDPGLGLGHAREMPCAQASRPASHPENPRKSA